MSRTEADALARELVTLRAFRWVAGMLPRSLESMADGSHEWSTDSRLDDYQPETSRPPAGGIPDLEDPATAALLAVQAMEAGARIEPHLDGDWSARFMLGEEPHGYYGPLGIVAARALIAIKGGG